MRQNIHKSNRHTNWVKIVNEKANWDHILLRSLYLNFIAKCDYRDTTVAFNLILKERCAQEREQKWQVEN